MELITILLIFAFVLLLFKIAGFLFRTGIVLISIPLQIALAVIVTVILVAVLPIALVSSVLALILVPLGLLTPLLPLFLVGFGIYIIARK